MKFGIIVLAVALTACSQEGRHEPAAEPGKTASGGDNGLLYGLMGFMLGQSMGSRAAPAPPPTPAVIERRTVIREVPAPPVKPAPMPTAPSVKPPVVTTSPQVPAPPPTAAAKPSYSGPSSYRSITQSAPSYSRSFSSPSVGRR